MRRFLIILTAVFAASGAQQLEAKHTVTPLVPGLGVFEAFFAQKTLIDAPKLKVSEDKNCKLTITPSYGLAFKFANYSNKARGVAAISRDYDDLSCAGYDAIVISFKPYTETGLCLELTAVTDAGERKVAIVAKRTKDARRYARRLVLPLKGAKKIQSIRLQMSLENAVRGGNWGTIYYMALRNDNRYNAYQAYLKNLENLPWDKLLKPESYTPKFSPRFGLFFKDKRELNEYRKFCKKTGRYAYLEKLARRTVDLPIEKLVDKELFISAPAAKRRHDLGIHGTYSFLYGPKLSSVAALISKNAKALRKVAKMAIIMAVAETWYEGGIVANYPGMSVVHIPFQESYAAVSMAKVLDFAGEMFTPAGLKYVYLNMVQKAVGPINYSAWTYHYFYHSNQGAIFNEGRVATYLILEKLGNTHVKPYTDLAMKELNESMDSCFAPDGGNIESTGYMMGTLGRAISSYAMYAQARNKKLAEVLPENLLRSASYAQAITSTSKNNNFSIIPYGCAWQMAVTPQVSAFMAAALPDSQWLRIFNCYGKDGWKDAGHWFEEKFYTWKFAQMVPAKKAPEHQAFLALKSNGLVSSTRKLGNDTVKLLFLGYNKGVGKRHSDKGSFMLEFAGDKIFIDPPYYSGFYSSSDYHNMLSVCVKNNRTPAQYLQKIRFGDVGKLLVPVAGGNKKSLHIKMNAGAAWDPKYFKSHMRYIDSPAPDEIIIKDVYTLGADGTGVNFNLQTYQKFKITGNKIVIPLENGRRVTVTAPADCKISTENYDLGTAYGGVKNKITRIIIHKDGKAGTLTVKINLK